MQIARGKFLVRAEGREHSCKVGELEEAVRVGCDSCDDLVSRLADISIGSIDSPDGFSTVIVRSLRGERLLEGVAYERREVRRDDVVRLAAIKRKNAEQNFGTIVAGLVDGLESVGEQNAEPSATCGHST
jgi:coenzyme F420-reducing hydrogenase beta subunit